MGEEKTGGWFGWLGDEMEKEDTNTNAIDQELENYLNSEDDTGAPESETEASDDEIEAKFQDDEAEMGEALALKNMELSEDTAQEDVNEDEVQDSNMRKFWTVCSTQRAYYCITYTKHFIPSINHHGMDNYVKSVEETHVFRTRQGTEKDSFNKALIAACQELEG